MPLYECHCARCDRAFEVLAALSESAAKFHPCPVCGGRARRRLSAVTFGRAGKDQPRTEHPADPSRPDVTRLKVPPPAQLCWMDAPSSARYAAHLHGRGAEYDETVAARAEAREQHGQAAPAVTHEHSHSPLADPAVYKRRRAAAIRGKKAPQPNA